MDFDRVPWGQVLSWYADQRGVPFQFEEEPWGHFSYRSPRRHTLDEAFAVIGEALPREFELAQNEGQLIVRRRPGSAQVTTIAGKEITRLRRPSEFGREFARLKAAIAEFEGWRQKLKEENQPDAPYTQYDDQIGKSQAALDILRAEYETQVKILACN